MQREGFFVSDLKNKNGFEFFAAANSGKGFISFFDKIFGSEKISRRYLIKGKGYV